MAAGPLSEWATGHGINTNNTYIFSAGDTRGQTLKASRHILRGECIVSCPPNMMVNNQYIIANSEIGKFIRCNPGLFDPLQLLMAFLLNEKSKGESSDWKLFISALPNEFSLPALWHRDLSDLLPSEAKPKFSEVTEYVESSCMLLEGIFLKEWNIRFSREEIRWAFCCVNTRCFYVAEHLNPLLNCNSIKNNMVLIPYLDMCNHNDHTTTDYDVNIDGCHIYAVDNIEKDSEVLLCYGNHSNYTLLFEYGFVTMMNPNDLAVLTREDILNALPEFRSVLSRSEQFNEYCKKELFFVASYEPSWAISTMLAALRSNDFDYFFQQYFSGYMEFCKQKDLYGQLCRYKINVFKDLLAKLKLAQGEASHKILLEDFLSGRLDLLIGSLRDES